MAPRRYVNGSGHRWPKSPMVRHIGRYFVELVKIHGKFVEQACLELLLAFYLPTCL